MRRFRILSSKNFSKGSRLTDFRKKALVITSSSFILNYIVSIYIGAPDESNLTLVANTIFILFLFGGTVTTLRAGKTLPLPFIVMGLLFLLVSSTLYIMQVGARGLFCFFPTIVAFAFLFPPRIVLAFGVSKIILSVILTKYDVGDPLNMSFVYAAAYTLIISTAFSILLRKNHIQVKEMSITDSMTGLLNRHELNNRLERSFALWRRSSIPSVLALIDIDNLKVINDTYGHDAGDQSIIGFSSLAKQMIRKNDSLFRTGGDEFLLILEGSDLEGAMRVLHKLKRVIDQSDSVSTSISIGATNITSVETIDQWVKSADDALYSAKNQGKNVVKLLPEDG